MLTSTTDLLHAAMAGAYAIGAFNVYNLEGVRAVINAAEASDEPPYFCTTIDIELSTDDGRSCQPLPSTRAPAADGRVRITRPPTPASRAHAAIASPIAASFPSVSAMMLDPPPERYAASAPASRAAAKMSNIAGNSAERAG